MKKKKKKNKDLFTKPTKATKRIKKNKSKRIKKKVKSPFKVIIRDWGNPMTEHKEKELNEDSKLEIHIDNNIYSVSIDKKNRCLQIGTHETHLYLQPIAVHQFLVKANTPKSN